ncbi:FSR family fosmidomycin resistance protein-like MFS transporter [Lentzea flaviverrucosa]|uniref:MFS transporter, FSR family, fosmidomycin resistance protein n=2 Tax=Lentzea flaviverrucosa TaxID=200379 RepID=A0A1H9XK59_9PSEU|nr:FSR family fosmidomycin resistance protein-like MFS transporter [Lentzea flaviverrucosa]SES46207.1 MFS transporter, FSR family, fosmidomycin resistance protein [Lentzea flaviverrucosa]
MSVLVAGHAVNDLYQGAVPAVVPFLVLERDYSYVAAAGITVAATLLSSVVQPLFGVLTDRRPMPWLVPLGMILAGAGIGLSGLSDSYLVTWLAIALSGLGVAAYHPEAARLARRVAQDSHVGMSWFAVGGNVGFALGPVLVTPVLAFGGLAWSPLLAVPALVGGLLTTVALRGVHGADAANQASAGRDDWGQFSRLTVVIVARSMVTFGLGTFLAIWVTGRVGGGPAAGAAALVVLFGVGAASTLLGGVLAGRFGRVRVLQVSYAAAVPAVAGVALVPGPAVYLMVALTAVALYVPFSLHVTLGQDYLPNRLGTAGGVTLGLAVSIGGLGSPVVGAIAGVWNLQWGLLSLVVLPIVAWVAARGLRSPVRV